MKADRLAKQHVSTAGAAAIVMGNMIGSGVDLLPATLGEVGSISIFSWLVVLAGMLALAYVCAVLSVLAPEANGLTAAIGWALGRWVGSWITMAYLVAAWIGNVAIAVVMAGYLERLLRQPHSRALAASLILVVIWLSTAVALTGPRAVETAAGLTLIVGLIPVAFVATVGWFKFDSVMFRSNWNVAGPSPFHAFAQALPAVAWAFLGFEFAGVAASLLKDPQRGVPRATLFGVAGVRLVYIAMSAAIMGLVPARVLANSPAPLADATEVLLGGGSFAAVIGV